MDKLKKPPILLVSQIGIEWKGSSAAAPSGFVRRVNLLGMEGPDNYFKIFLSEKAVQLQQSQEGILAVWGKG